jgi:DNA repair photolyase
MNEPNDYIKGRGAQVNSDNPFFAQQVVRQHDEGIDEWDELHRNDRTQYIEVFPKTILNKVDSPDIGMGWSMNPYQGCEHGCIYCYARNTHNYWGYSAGVEFEQKILVKKNAPELLEQALMNPKWEPAAIMFSGNTDCYQPAERKFEITRKMLQVLLKFKHPTGIISKNTLMLRDLDILTALNRLNLLHVSVSFTSLDEKLRGLLEPRTASAAKKLKLIETLSKNDIPVNVMLAPVIPAINSDEIAGIVKATADAGAQNINYLVVRLNGAIGGLFTDWVHKKFPDRAQKVLHQIEHMHGGSLNDSRFGKRMSGEGNFAMHVKDIFTIAKNKYYKGRKMKPYDYTLFERPAQGQLSLFKL